MGGSQAALGQFTSGTADAGDNAPSDTPPEGDAEESQPDHPLLGFEDGIDSPSLPADVQTHREADWVVYTGRYPHVFDAGRLGFGIGHREDSSYQWAPSEVSLATHFLDNDYRDASLERFVSRVFEYQPEIAVLGDIYDADSLDDHLRAGDEVWSSYPEMELMLVPKCAEVLENMPDKYVVGYPNGKSPVQATDIAAHHKWRTLSNRIHVLGGTPLSTLHEIRELTKPVVTDIPKADIAGLDWNGYQLYAENHGDYASPSGGWHRNLRDDYVPKRDLIRYSLLNAKHFWISHGVWPGSPEQEGAERSELLAADTGDAITAGLDGDVAEMLVSPNRSTHRHHSPLVRTDQTQTEIIEPLSPLAQIVGTGSWSPDGKLESALTYDPPGAHHTEATCSGCGGQVFAEPRQCRGYNPTAEDPHLTVELVSYEQQKQETEHDYESVAENGPAALSIQRTFPAIHCFCSPGCRRRAERKTPHLLLDRSKQEHAHPNGSTIGTLTVTPQRY